MGFPWIPRQDLLSHSPHTGQADAKVKEGDLPIFAKTFPGQPAFHDHEACQLMNYLYGCRQSSYFWHDTIVEFFLQTGAQKLNEEGTLFMHKKGNSVIIHGLWVDDMIHCTNDIPFFEEFRSKLSRKYEITTQNDVTDFSDFRS